MSAAVRQILCSLLQNNSICARPPQDADIRSLVATAIALDKAVDAALSEPDAPAETEIKAAETAQESADATDAATEFDDETTFEVE
ncbi:MAG: hypothetical protein VW362_02405 [Candidatus Nanopelagicales bacterium]